MIYSILTTSSHYCYFLIHDKEGRHRLFLIKSFNDLLIKPTSPFVDDRRLHETFQSFKREISMLILTEGEKYLLTMFSLISYEEQGLYHLIYLLGSTFPRTIFSTIEQITLNYFQQTFAVIRFTLNAIENNQLRQDDPEPPTPNGIYNRSDSLSNISFPDREQLNSPEKQISFFFSSLHLLRYIERHSANVLLDSNSVGRE